MKYFFCTGYIFLTICFNTFAQNSIQKTKEVGLNFKGLNNIGFRYGFGNEKTLLRITIASLSGSNENSKSLSSSGSSKDKSFAAGLSFGLERRKLITNRIYFSFGPEISSSYSKRSHDSGSGGSNSEWVISHGLGFALGLLYSINENLSITSEIVPAIKYSYGKNYLSGIIFNNNRNTSLDYSLISPGAGLTLSYRFIKNN